jgi:DNA-binding NtrC family response regulator
VGFRILVIDDEALIRWSISENLEAHGHTLMQADDAASAVEALRDPAELPDVVVVDYRLPDSRDLTLLRTIRRLAPHAAIVMMTAFGTPEMVKEALELGAHRVISKPFDLAQLAALVDEAYDARS